MQFTTYWTVQLFDDRPGPNDEICKMLITLRAAVVADSDEIARLFIASRLDAMPYLPKLYTDDEVRWWIVNVVLKQTHVVLAVSPDLEILGFSSVQAQSLEHLYVAPGWQGRGVGALLLGEAKRRSPDGLHLHVFQRNARARVFYSKHDFEMIALRDGSQNEEGEPDAIYGWPGTSNSENQK